jgi:hypothetical protein
MGRGELIMGAALGLLGLFWALVSLKLKYMSEFAPGSGFLPFWLGVALVVLSILFIIGRLRKGALNHAHTGDDSNGDSLTPISGRPVAIALGLIVCVGVIDYVGFIAAVTVYLVYLTRLIERESWLASLSVSAGATVVLYLIFHSWLGVPLPRGPWGF